VKSYIGTFVGALVVVAYVDGSQGEGTVNVIHIVPWVDFLGPCSGIVRSEELFEGGVVGGSDQRPNGIKIEDDGRPNNQAASVWGGDCKFFHGYYRLRLTAQPPAIKAARAAAPAGVRAPTPAEVPPDRSNVQPDGFVSYPFATRFVKMWLTDVASNLAPRILKGPEPDMVMSVEMDVNCGDTIEFKYIDSRPLPAIAVKEVWAVEGPKARAAPFKVIFLIGTLTDPV
jgi:hypothetical protein